jgi:dGTPase
MDIADDIAYSVYDLEDSLKAGFLTIYDFLNPQDSNASSLKEKVRSRINKALDKEKVQAELYAQGRKSRINKALKEEEFTPLSEVGLTSLLKQLRAPFRGDDVFDVHNILLVLASKGFLRTQLTSAFIKRLMMGIDYQFNPNYPEQTRVFLRRDYRILCEYFKALTYLYQIDNPRLKIVKYRGTEIVETIFNCIEESEGDLLPDNFKFKYDNEKDPSLKRRIIADFIAGMTDSFAIAFHGRLKSENPETIFKPF